MKTSDEMDKTFADWETWEEITKDEFDKAALNKEFQRGPVISTFGDHEGDPYRPNRQAFGIMKNGRKVRAWVR